MWRTALKNGPKQTISLQIFKGCLPQTLLGPFLNTLPYLRIETTFGIRVTLLVFKVNVMTLKKLSIPCLELLFCVLLGELLNEVLSFVTAYLC